MVFARRIMKLCLGAAVLIAAAMAGPAAVSALEINGYTPARHDRFISGYPEHPVANPDFFAAGYDWSGTGWDAANANRSVALISPLHFVCSRHYEVPVGGTVSFVNRDGLVKSYTVAGYSIFPSDDGGGVRHVADLALGRLSRPVEAADKIGYYPVLYAEPAATTGSAWNRYVGREVIYYGETARAGINTIYALAFITTNKTNIPDNRTFGAVSDSHPGAGARFPDETGFSGGDSGGPSFLVWNGRLTLIGTHFSIAKDAGRQYNVDSFLPYYLPQLNTAMNGSGYTVSTIEADPGL